MSDRYLDLKNSRLSWNYIPSGRQLPRTPPLTSVKKHLDFSNEDSNEDYEEPQQSLEADTRVQDGNNQNMTFDFNTIDTKAESVSEPDDPNSMLKGMKGYQLTLSDLEFIKKMKEEKLIKKLQGDLEELQRLLKKEMGPLELAYTSREKAQAELEKIPSCEDLTEWVKVVLEMTSPSTELTDLDAKSLFAMVTEESIQRATNEKRTELTGMEKMLANKRKKEAKERGQLEKQIASEQLKIQGLMGHLSDLKSELAQQEAAYKALEMQINAQEAPEIKAEEVDSSEELQAAKRQRKRRTKPDKSTEKLQTSTKQSESTRSKLADSKTGGAQKNTSESLKAKQKSGAAAEKQTKSVKEARGPQKRVEQQKSQESVPAVRGRRKPPRPAASQPENQSHVKTEEAPSTSQQGRKQTAGEETVLRRSKRIASRS